MKRKVSFIVFIALALALSIGATAGAKYAGYAYNNPIKNADGSTTANPYPGYLSWIGATEVYERNVPGGTDMISAHGGYVTSTTKCAVCHSAHRAWSPAATTSAAAPKSTSLTTGMSCVNCHTSWGAGGATKKIEWANLFQYPNDGGPHSHSATATGSGTLCANPCHTGGVHGGSDSKYNGMNAFMLGSDKDDAITKSFQNGNTKKDVIAYDPQATAGQGGTGENWFQSGSTGAPPLSNQPAGTTSAQFAAAKATATGFTCSYSGTGYNGCHSSAMYAVNTWGFSENRLADPRTSATGKNVNKTGDYATGMLAMTGHVTSTTLNANYGTEYSQCGPCHAGAPAGGYRTQGNRTGTSPAPIENFYASAFGCDQCHDMVGKATNSTAWPHGNRRIAVWEWDDTNSKVAIDETDMEDGNIWMYASSIVGNVGHTRDSYGEATRIPADPSFRVIKDAVGHASGTGFTVGNINDGVCLKCHIAVDKKSIAANAKLDAGKEVNVATEHGHELYVGTDGVLKYRSSETPFIYKPGTTYTGTSTQIYLWK